MKIGILMCGHTAPELRHSHTDYDQMFEKLLDGHGFTFASFDVENMQFPPSIETCDGWLLTGSKHGVYEEHPFIAPLEDFIRAAYATSIPMAGICFGHQLIAQALGGRVEKYAGGWALGSTAYEFIGKGTMQLNAWHQDQVLDLPKDATPIATNDFCAYPALVYGDKAITVQPHPEFKGDLIAGYANLRRGTMDYPDHLMDQALARKDDPDDNARIGDMIAAFFLKSETVTHA